MAHKATNLDMDKTPSPVTGLARAPGYVGGQVFE